MKLAVRVQHHPARPHLLAPLLARLPADTQVISAEPGASRNPWREYRRCLEAAGDSTHLLVLQDDTILCRNFIPAAQLAIEAKPGAVICFCVCGEPYEAASALVSSALRGDSWCKLLDPRWVPVVATAWPSQLLAPALEYVDAQFWPDSFRSDDEIAGHITRHLEVEVWATAPSLVEHDYTQPSVMRKHPLGADPARVAACYIGDCDPLTIDWAA